MIIQTRAFVLRTYAFRETSVLVTLYTRERGKVKAICKGVRQLKSKQMSHFDPPSLLHVTLYDKPNRELQLVSDTQIENHYTIIKSSVISYMRVAYCMELIDRMTQLHLPHETLFRLVEMYLHFLNEENSELFTTAFELKFLTILGMFPNVLSCMQCGAHIDGDVGFVLRSHGIVCLNEECGQATDYIRLSRNTVESMYVLIKSTFNDLFSMRSADIPLNDIKKITDSYVRYLTDNRLKTSRVLDELLGHSSTSQVLRENSQYC